MLVELTKMDLLYNYGKVSTNWQLVWYDPHFSKNSWKRCERVSPVTSTTFGISARGALLRLPGTRFPTTSLSGYPSASLFAPALSDGGPRGLADDDRICDRLGLPTSLDGVGAASEFRTASRREDIAYAL